MKTILKYLGIFCMLTLVGLMIGGVLHFADFVLLFGGAGTTYASAIAGGVTTQGMNTYNTNVIKDVYEQTLTLIRADEFPMDQLLRNTKKTRPWNSYKVIYPEVEVRPVEDTVASTSSAASTDTTANYATIAVTNPDMWMVDDVMRVQGYNDGAGRPLTLLVAQIDGANLKCYPINGQGTAQGAVGYNGGTIGYTVPSIPSTTAITRIGHAKYETDAQTDSYNAVPATGYNYMQIHMAQIEQSKIYDKVEKNINYDYDTQQLLAMYAFRNEAESTALFGSRGYRRIGQEDRYFSGGAEFFVSNVMNYGSEGYTDKFTDDKWIDITKNIFTANSGSDQRILFAGKDLIAAISKIDTVAKQINATTSTDVVWGITFSRVKTNFGEVLIKYHKMLDQHGWAKNGFIFDMNNIDKYVLEPFAKKTMDYDTNGQKRVKADRMLETSCLAFKYGATHAILKPFGVS